MSGFWRRGGVSLRRRLIAGLLALLVVVLTVSGAATYLLLRSFLSGRIDADLHTTLHAARHAVDAAQVQPASERDRLMASAIRAVLPPGGVVRASPTSVPVLTVIARDPRHRAPSIANVAPLGNIAVVDGPPRLLDTRLAGNPYRVIAAPLDVGGQMVIAEPAGDAQATLNRLTIVGTVVGAAAVLTVALGALLVVRRGLRPLDQIASTAGKITAGDRSQRVPPVPDSPTEIGRVTSALNQMLDENEVAFAAKDASEGRLRQFVADASHELRTPLASVRSYAELLRSGRTVTTADHDLAVRRIEAEAVRMSGLVEDLLLLARLDQGRPLRHEQVDLRAVIADAVADHRTIERHHPVNVDVDGDIRLRGDADRLRQVIVNLLANTRAHTPSGTHVHLVAARTGDQVVLEVADEGPGMSAQQSGRIFERFYRADPARARSEGGSTSGAGLGLAIVAGIINAHGGTVSVTTAPGAGTRFTIHFPYHRLDPSEPTTATPALTAPRRVRPT